MKNLFFALLTTLFVSAMPLQAAYATADGAQTKEACSTISYKTAFTDEQRVKVLAENGTITELEGVRAKAFQERIEEVLDAKAPFTSDQVLIVNPDGEVGGPVNIGFFVNDCLKAYIHLPEPVVEQALSPLVKKPGERVD